MGKDLRRSVGSGLTCASPLTRLHTATVHGSGDIFLYIDHAALNLALCLHGGSPWIRRVSLTAGQNFPGCTCHERREFLRSRYEETGS